MNSRASTSDNELKAPSHPDSDRDHSVDVDAVLTAISRLLGRQAARDMLRELADQSSQQ